MHILIVAAALSLVILASPASGFAHNAISPAQQNSDGWPTATPDSLGVSAKPLADMATAVARRRV
jgi:hypothetical protein